MLLLRTLPIRCKASSPCRPAATCFLSFLILFFEMPDTKDLTAAQIDERFENRAKTRGFRAENYQSNPPSLKDIEMGKAEEVETRNK